MTDKARKFNLNGIVNFNWNTQKLEFDYNPTLEIMKVDVMECIIEYSKNNDDFAEKINKNPAEREKVIDKITNMVIYRDKKYMKYHENIVKEITLKIYNIRKFYEFRINDVKTREIEKKIKEVKESINPELDKLQDELQKLKGERSFIDY